MKIDHESITVVRPEPPSKLPRTVKGWRLKDQDDSYFADADCLGPWYESDPAKALLFSTYAEALAAKRVKYVVASFAQWRIVKVVKVSADDCYFAGILQGKKNLARDINELMEKHHTGSNADTLNAIGAFLQGYLK